MCMDCMKDSEVLAKIKKWVEECCLDDRTGYVELVERLQGEFKKYDSNHKEQT